MNISIVINDAPYGSEEAYNALRVALSLQKEHEGVMDHRSHKSINILIKSFCEGSRGAVFSKRAPLAAGGKKETQWKQRFLI